MCDSDNAQYLKRYIEYKPFLFEYCLKIEIFTFYQNQKPRRIKFDSVDVHPIEKALIVFYRIEAILLSQDGEPMAGEKRVSEYTLLKIIRCQ